MLYVQKEMVPVLVFALRDTSAIHIWVVDLSVYKIQIVPEKKCVQIINVAILVQEHVE